MTDEPITVLLIEDDPSHAHLVRRHLSDSTEARFHIHWADRLAAGLEYLRQKPVDVVLLDLGLPDSGPAATLQRVLEAAPNLPVVVLTTTDDPQQALAAVKAGAQDHLPKPRVTADLLTRSICYAIERKRSEQQLKHLNETLERRVAERSALAEQRARSLSRLASELSQAERRERRRLAHFLHDDLQQLIAASRMRVDILAACLQKPRDKQMAHQASSLLEQAMQSSRSMTVDLTPPILSQRGLGAGLQWLTRRVLDQHGLKVELDLRGEPQNLSDDTASLLLEAARELLFNVVKHAHVQQARVTLDTEPQSVLLAVEDEGPGFDPTTAIGGEDDSARFGLFSIRERLGAIGGSMEFQVAPGHGVTIKLRAPYGPSAEEAATPAAETQADDGIAEPAESDSPREDAIRVLLVDDHRIVREGLAAAIAGERDLQLVGQAESGHTALAFLQHQPVHVVVTDISMPGLNGIETTRRIRQQWPAVQVVGLSMHEPEDMASTMLAAGAFAHLSKSGPIDDLLEAIRAAVRTSTVIA